MEAVRGKVTRGLWDLGRGRGPEGWLWLLWFP